MPATDIDQPRLAAARKRRGLTQSELAARTGTSAQHLAFIEAGVNACRLDIAQKISEALDTELRLLFPGAVKALGDRQFRDLSDEQLALADSLGIDADPREWRARGTLSGGQEVLWQLGSADMRRMFDALQRLDGNRFFVFDSGATRVLLNLDHLWSCQLLYDPPMHGQEVTVNWPPKNGRHEVCYF